MKQAPYIQPWTPAIETYYRYEIEETEVDPPASQRLGDLEMQTLIVLGEEDRDDIARAADELINSIPHARLITMPGAAHVPSLGQPDQFNAILADFLVQLD